MALAQHESLARLAYLDLRQNALTVPGAEALQQSPHLRRLLRLNVSAWRYRLSMPDPLRDMLREHFGSALEG